ncbi:MAG: aminotransferase class III-fold pyridoxal phosphate-dependent enzyme, partial [Deltaproteobacteria bacterium]
MGALKTENSRRLYERACKLMPAGVSSPVRAFRSVGGRPIFFERAEGATFVDADGNSYVDFCQSWGPLILGHARPEVVEAVQDAAGHGLSFGACCRREIELAELILEGFPSMDMVRFVSSGTEAVMTAVRLARGYTGRAGIVKFSGGYHGHSDSLLVKAGSGLVTFGTSSSAGVPEDIARNTIVVPFDDEQVLEDVFSRHGDSIAAAIVEPLPANNGLLEQRPEWMKLLRRLCTTHGSLLICDEVITGFRFRYGGYSQQIGIEPDLVTLGKIIGGGMPVGAVVGPGKIMERLAPLGDVYQAGTLSGNPVAMAAGAATLGILKRENPYEALDRLGGEFDRALRSAAKPGWLAWRRVGS